MTEKKRPAAAGPKPKGLPEHKAEAEVPFETGMDELFKFLNGMTGANVKRTYDATQSQDMAHGDVMRTIQETIAGNVTNLAQQIAQNAVTHAHSTNSIHATLQAFALKQHLSLNNLAADRMWNVDEQGWQIEKILSDKKFQDAIAASVIKIVGDMATSAAAKK